MRAEAALSSLPFDHLDGAFPLDYPLFLLFWVCSCFPAAPGFPCTWRFWPCGTSWPPSNGRRPHHASSPPTVSSWAWLSRVWSGWRQALVFVQPATVIKWQRRRFREHWTRLSRRQKPGASRHPGGGQSVDPQDVAGRLQLGSATPPRGVGEAGHRGGGINGPQVHAPAPQAALPHLARVHSGLAFRLGFREGQEGTELSCRRTADCRQ
jgi:hypothetical protein